MATVSMNSPISPRKRFLGRSIPTEGEMPFALSPSLASNVSRPSLFRGSWTRFCKAVQRQNPDRVVVPDLPFK